MSSNVQHFVTVNKPPRHFHNLYGPHLTEFKYTGERFEIFEATFYNHSQRSVHPIQYSTVRHKIVRCREAHEAMTTNQQKLFVNVSS